MTNNISKAAATLGSIKSDRKAASSRANGKLGGRPVPLKTWRDDIKVGIWDDEWVLKLYEGKAILHMPYVKWAGNSGSLADRVIRYGSESGTLARFKKIEAMEREDDEDYTEMIRELVWDV